MSYFKPLSFLNYTLKDISRSLIKFFEAGEVVRNCIYNRMYDEQYYYRYIGICDQQLKDFKTLACTENYKSRNNIRFSDNTNEAECFSSKYYIYAFL